MEAIKITKKIIDNFQYTGNDEITEVVLENEVEEIGVGAFHGCHNLKKVVLGGQIKLVKEGAFSDCPKLEHFKYSKNTIFENHCFNYSGGLVTLIEDENVARTFYFPVDHQYAITFKNKELSTDEYEVYEGRMAQQAYFPRGAIDTKQKLLYFVVYNKNGKEYSWFNTDLNMAIQSAAFKASGLSYNEFFKTKLTMDSRLNWDQYSLLIGVCITGKPLWKILIQSIGYDQDGTPTAQEILDVLKNFDNDLFIRTELAFARAHVRTNFLDYNKMYSGSLFRKNFIEMLRTQGTLVKLPKE